MRQVGKTYLLKEFGGNEFARAHYLNFEEEPKLCGIFKQDLNPERIIQDLEFTLHTSIDQQNDLIIFDEIQACPEALTSLKYFHEKRPHLAIVCAGSLLGLHLGGGSFPVGKVEVLSLFPMSFREFLEAAGDKRALDVLDSFDKREISEIAHSHLWQRLKQYIVVGGLPESVQIFCTHQNTIYSALLEVRKQQHTLVNAYLADMAKHSGKINAMHLNRVWKGTVSQIAQAQDDSISRFKFKGVVPGISHYDRLAGAIDWLCACGLTHKIPIATPANLPLSAYTKENQFKLLLFDIGILGALAGLSPKAILDYDYGSYKGFMVENFIAQELICSGHTPLYSWKENQAEVDFLCEINGELTPIEVKAGKQRQAKSLSQLCNKYAIKKQIIFNALPPSSNGNTTYLPLYLIECI